MSLSDEADGTMNAGGSGRVSTESVRRGAHGHERSLDEELYAVTKRKRWSIDSGTSRVEASANFVLPFEPKKGPERDFRAALRESLKGMPVTPDAGITATFAGYARKGSDLENLLLYNVGTSALGSLTTGGVHLEWDRTRQPERRYVYAPGLPNGLRYWTEGDEVARFQVELDQPSTWNCSKVWWATKQSGIDGVQESLAGPLYFQCVLSGPEGVNIAARMKPLLDGVLSAMHCH
jgi:hypothetical protein